MFLLPFFPFFCFFPTSPRFFLRDKIIRRSFRRKINFTRVEEGDSQVWFGRLSLLVGEETKIGVSRAVNEKHNRFLHAG